MNRSKLNYLRSYIPWLVLILTSYAFTALLLWLADIKIFQALSVFLFTTTIILFSIICFVLVRKETRKAAAYKNFLADPDKNKERELTSLCDPTERAIIADLAKTLYKKKAEIEKANTQLTEYEDYVETWAHEIKLPLALLTLVTDNRREELPQDLAFKLDYTRNQIQENIAQILFYYRVRSEKKDYLFENFDLGQCINEVLADFKPLLEEKNFRIKTEELTGLIYTDRRSFEFIVRQITGNAIKYCQDQPELWISVKKKEKQTILVFKDNGCGVKACDLPYLFEKGFTGDSGEIRKKSTGMGLYLVKQLADNLKIDITIRSKWQEGFEITLYI